MQDELTRIETLFNRRHENPFGDWIFDFETAVDFGEKKFPLWKISCGNKKPDAVTLILVGGVHGLEKIGSQLCISLMEKYFELSFWDPVFQAQLKLLRLVFIPMVNPVGVFNLKRSNGNGIDLMRNSPIVAKDPVPFLIGGHRFSNKLPWFQGIVNQKMEIESQFLVNSVLSETNSSQAVISLDIHSGFGLNDQIWFPWAFTKKPFPRLDLMQLMTEYFETTCPDHVYKIEPQSKVYCTHGDLWDYLLHDQIKNSKFLPLTLELGSWIWIKKNPLQIFNIEGLFNPIKQHRIKRTFRRHQVFVDFLTRFLIFMQSPAYSKLDFMFYYEKGLVSWYDKKAKPSENI